MATKKTAKKKTATKAIATPPKNRAVKSPAQPSADDQVVKRTVGRQPVIIDGKFRRPGETVFLTPAEADQNRLWLQD